MTTHGPYYEPPPPTGPEPLPEWLRGEGECNDVVLSSRVRLARNLAGFPFATKASKRDRQKTLELCREAILGVIAPGSVKWEELTHAPGTMRSLLMERHLISKQMSRGRQGAMAPGEDPRGVAYTVPQERLAVMVNEEDHLRIQSIRSGLALGDAWREADEFDDLLESRLDYAFSERFGYLTACPTNVGTGLRMSAMLHLPALRLSGDVEKVKRAAAEMNLAVRGFHGEGSEAVGDLFQISNQTTFGRAEGAVREQLEKDILPRVVEYERLARREMMAKRRVALEDQVGRALGVLMNARLMTTEEAMQALSMARLGLLLGLIPVRDKVGAVRTVNLLWLLVQPAHLQLVAGRDLDQEQRRAARASLIRQRLSALN